MDDIWNDLSATLSSPTTTFFPPAPPSTTTTPTTILTLLTPNSVHQHPLKKPKPHPPPEHTEKFRRLMKNRESAARSRARKQARADELEHEVIRLAKENAKLKKLHEEVCISHVSKEAILQRSKSAPF